MFSSMICGVTNTLNLKKNADPRADPKIAMREIQKRNVELEAYIKKIELNNDELLLMTTTQQRGVVPALAQKEKAKVQRSAAPMVKQNLALGTVLQPGVVEMNLRLHMDFRSAGQEGSTQRQMFIKDLRQDLADASGMYTADFNILKVSPGSVVVDVNAPETAAQEIHRQSLDLNSRLRCGKLTRFIDTITLPAGVPELPLPQTAALATQTGALLLSAGSRAGSAAAVGHQTPVVAAPCVSRAASSSAHSLVRPFSLNTREASPNFADASISALTLLAADGFAGTLTISPDVGPGLHRQHDSTPVTDTTKKEMRGLVHF